jgi:5-methylthioadenosine/S-adenosylhomocysteine deaminase
MAAERRIVHATVVTQDDARRVLTDGEVAYSPSTGLITYVGPTRGPAASGDLDVAGSIVMPGLVNAHTHSAMTPLRGYSDDRDLQAWLAGIRAFEELMTAADIRAGLQLALAEMIRNGITCFADMFLWDETLLADVASAGLRVLAAPAVFGHDALGYPAALVNGKAQTGRDALDLTEQLASTFAGDAQVRIAFGPHAPYTCPPELLADVAARASRLGVPVHIHLSETAFEVEQCRAQHGCTPIELARDRGLFGGSVLVAHCVHPDPSDLEILAAADASVSHNPVSNLKLGAGIAPLAELRAAGVRTALGTDSVASNNNLDLFEEIKTGTILHRGRHQVSDLVSGSELLDMATRDGAAAVGFGSSGALAVGRAADLIVLAVDSTRATPLISPVSFLAFAARGDDVRHVVVGGRELMRDGTLLTVDEDTARAAVAATATRITGQISPAFPTV